MYGTWSTKPYLFQAFLRSNLDEKIENTKAVCEEKYKHAIKLHSGPLGMIVKGMTMPSLYSSLKHKVKLLRFGMMKRKRELRLKRQWWRER